MNKDYSKRIVIDPKIMVGKPVIKGTRIPVDAILKRVAENMSIDDILEDFPNLNRKDIQAALIYAAAVLRGEDIIPIMAKP